MDKKGSSIFLKNFLVSITVILLAIVLVLLGMAIEKSRNADKKVDNTKNEEKGNTKNENNMKEPIKGKINITSEKLSETLSVNGTDYELAYNFIEDSGPGKDTVVYDNKTIYEKPCVDGIRDIEYTVFTASDNKEYILVVINGVANDAYILNENGEVLKQLSNLVEEEQENIRCLILNNEEELFYVENGSVYYYKFAELESEEELTAKMNIVKIDINNGSIVENETGEQKVMNLGQCA